MKHIYNAIRFVLDLVVRRYYMMSVVKRNFFRPAFEKMLEFEETLFRIAFRRAF